MKHDSNKKTASILSPQADSTPSINSGQVGSPQAVQDIQDKIFRKMTADRKIRLGSQLWVLAKELTKEKGFYGNNRPKTVVGKGR